MLAQALGRARWTIFWERLWPGVASIATVIGLFLAVSWLGLWLALPPIGRAIGLGAFFLLAAAAFAPLLALRLPSRTDGLRRLDRNSTLPHRPATAIDDELAVPTTDSYALTLWRAHIERALRTATSLKAGLPAPRLARRDPFALRALVLVLVVATFFAAGGERMKRIGAAFDWQGVMVPANFRIDAWVSPPTYTGRPPLILQGLRPGEPVSTAANISVPAGSTLVVRATGIRLDVVASGGLSDPKSGAQTMTAKGTEERQFVINDTGSVTIRGAAARDLTWRFIAIPDKPPTIALAKDPEGQARGTLVLSYKVEDDYGVVGAQATFKLLQGLEGTNGQPPRPLYDAPDVHFGAAASAHQKRRRADQQGSDRASMGGCRYDHDLGRPRRGRQRRQQRAVRIAPARAAVHQADGARADRAAARARARRRCAGPCAQRPGRAGARAGTLRGGNQRLSRLARDLLGARARQERRATAGCRRPHVEHGGQSRGWQRFRCRAGFARRPGGACVRRWSGARATRRSSG